MNFSFGTDPEFILIDEKGNLKSAIDIVKKDKKNKLKFKDNLFFYDNVLIECVVNPGYSKKETINNIRQSLNCCAQLVYPYKITNISSGEFNEKELDHADARKSGCDPEYCAYELKKISSRKIKKIIEKSNLRTAGGHIHLGTSLGKEHQNCIMLIRMLDLFLGTTSILIDQCPSSIKRRKLYGAAGRYRQPSHGVEYRTLSNFWLASPCLVELIYEICEFVINKTEAKIYEKFWTVDHNSLESDNFWNLGGDPADCHKCHGYDCELLRKMFEIDTEEAYKMGNSVFEITNSFLPNNIKEKIKYLKGQKFDIYKEWKIDV